MMKKKLVKDGESAYNVIFNMRQSILSCSPSKLRTSIVNKLNNVLGTLDSATDEIYQMPIGDFVVSIRKDLTKAKKKVKKLEKMLSEVDDELNKATAESKDDDCIY